MSYYETAYPSLVSGVSQQLIQDRLPGQLTSQKNMMSDLVRGLCRRPPVSFIKQFPTATVPSGPEDSFWRMASVTGKDVLTRLDTVNNVFTVFDPVTGVQYPCNVTAAALTYITPVTAAATWRNATLGSDSFFWSPVNTLSTNQDPSITYQDPTRAGYFYVVSGVFNTKFEVSITNITSGITYTATYTTPNGTGAGDPALSNPAYIADQLKTSMDGLLTGAGLVYTSAISGAYVFYKMTAVPINVSPLTSLLYLRASEKQQVKLSSDLPAQLPALGADFIVQVGEDASAVYYRYDTTRIAWLEEAAYSQQTIINNICLRLAGTPALYILDVLNSERRAAGNTTLNPLLNFVTRGVTGIASFKGRLVLLSGQYVALSAVNKPERWFRSTVTALADNDPIEVAAAVEFNSDYKAAVEFNGSLLVTSDRNQAIMPGDGALTPRTASLSVVSNYSVSSDIAPRTIGRSVMLPFNRVAGYLGISEALPPDSLESPLVATDITAHIPNYLSGVARFMTSSSNADILIVGAGNGTSYSDPFKALYVHQFLWSGTEKVKSAWHTWNFQHAIQHAYFLQDVLYIVFSVNALVPQTYLGKINLGRGDVPTHFLDYAALRTVTVGLNLTPPSDYMVGLNSLALFKASGVNTGRGEVAQVTYPLGVTTITPADPEEGDTYYMGFPFESSFIPTPPVFRDRNDNVLANEHIPLRCFKAQLNDSGLITARVQDRAYDSGDFQIPIVGLYQPALIGSGLLKSTGEAIIPARTEGSETILTLRTSDYYDMNVTTLEYGFRLSLKHRRA